MITERLKKALQRHKDLVYRAFLDKDVEERKIQERIVAVLEELYGGKA